MSLHISKNAINNIPLTDENLTDDSIGGVLLNEPLSTSKYLIKLAKNDVDYQKLGLKYKSFGQHITILKMALTAIDAIYDEYTIPNELIATGIFDVNLENAIKIFQGTAIFTANKSIDINGIVDSKTLLAIDAALSQDHIFDYEKKKYVGRVSSKSSFYIGSDISNPNPNYKIIIEGGDEITIEAQPEFGFSYINSGNDDKHVYGVPNKKFQTEIDKHPLVIAKNSKRALEGIPPIKSIGFAKLDYNLEFGNASVPMGDIQNELSKTAPLLFDDSGAKQYKIKEGDSLSQIVLENYYGGVGYVIVDPYKKVPIFTLPGRTPFSEANRHEDARFQFYHNLLYYYNSEKIGDNPVKEWGFRTNGYERYSVNHLDLVNIFDNKFIDDDEEQEGDPKTALPNYYRFLKRMEELNPNSKMAFDSLGNTTSFTTITGENIWIPSRKFADAMYYFLNFRHDEMLVEEEDPDDESSTILNYIKNEALDNLVNRLESAIGKIVDISEEVKTDAVALYHETIDFFISAYNYVTQSLVDYWPRGLGGKFGIGGSLVWGAPVKIKSDLEKSIYRKMSKADELTLVFNRDMIVELGLVQTNGFRIGFGQYSGHGHSKKLIGFGYGYSLDGGIELTQSTEYEFPIRQNETALLTAIMTVFVDEVVRNVVKFFLHLDLLNVDARQYLTKTEFKFNAKVGAKVNAFAGVFPTDNNNHNIPIRSNADAPEVQESNKGYGLINNIFEKIPSVRLNTAGDFNGGFAYGIEVKYDKKPFTQGNKGRVFKEMEIDYKYFIGAQVDTTFINNLFKTLSPVSGPNIGSNIVSFFKKLAENLSSEKKGITLGKHYKLTRTGSPNSVTNDDFLFNVVHINEDNKTLEYEGKNIKKEVSLYFGASSGDPGSLAEPGTEVKFKLNMPTLYDLWLSSLPIVGPTHAIKIFKGIEYQKKVGLFNFDSKTDKIADNGLCIKILKIIKSTKFFDINSDEIKRLSPYLEKMIKNTKSGLCLNLKMEIEFSEVVELMQKVLEFHLKKLYLKYVLLASDSEKQDNVDISLDTQKEKIQKILKQENVEEGKDHYTKMYSNETFHNTKTNKDVDGLLLYITKEIGKNGDPNGDYSDVIPKFLMGVINMDAYMNNKTFEGEEDTDYGVSAFLDVFSFIAVLGGLQVKLESRLSKGYEEELTLGGGGDVVGEALRGFIEVNFQPTFFENGLLTDLPYNDPLRKAFDAIDFLLGKLNKYNRVGAKTLFQVLKK
ncbi:hypothetical protein BB050_00567 [Flavobacterium anhuiense]|uniref:Uncharacterized protein n=1 Tax=Flavobacterium anhuiense TaxID=459526 RepID=A0AAC9CX66_9FLAO|nr:hypothetical protein [Flavobacterium anhuiense]AOC93721.1 hypothetical protein BB050_00567 [Flavobacterium anhuiense]